MLDKNQQGYSIIEIMIVLTVIGMITIGIILAGQSISRGIRNNARTQDARKIVGHILNYKIANKNNLPTNDNSLNIVSFLTDGNSTDPNFEIFSKSLNLSQYDSSNTKTRIGRRPGNIRIRTVSYWVPYAGEISPNVFYEILGEHDFLPDENNIHIWGGYSCPDNIEDIESSIRPGRYSHSFPATNRNNFVVVYKMEGGGSPWRCEDTS